MKSIDQIRIQFEPSFETYNSITNILGINPIKEDLTFLPNKNPNLWTFEKVVESGEPFYDFINEFLDILENNYEKLEKIGIKRDNITFWFLYEYDQQCNMEFDPIRLKRLGDNGITLCISCWESSLENDSVNE